MILQSKEGNEERESVWAEWGRFLSLALGEWIR